MENVVDKFLFIIQGAVYTGKEDGSRKYSTMRFFLENNVMTQQNQIQWNEENKILPAYYYASHTVSICRIIPGGDYPNRFLQK